MLTEQDKAEIQANVHDRECARALLHAIAELLNPELEKLPTDRARTIFWELMREAALKRAPLAKTESLQNDECEELDSDVKEAIEIANYIIDLSPDVPSAGTDFAESVREKAEDIRATILERECVTDGQIDALENMKDGLDRWLHR